MSHATLSGLHVEDSGAGAPVLLLHSSGLSGRQWRKLVAALVDRGMRAVVPDLTGHGASSPWPEPDPLSFRVDVDRVADVTTADEHERWLRRFVDYWSGVGSWDALREDARSEFRRVGWAVREGVRSLVEDTTGAATFASLAVPVHLFTAENSPLAAGRVVQRLGDAIAGARVTRIPGVGHMGPVANADVVNPLLLSSL